MKKLDEITEGLFRATSAERVTVRLRIDRVGFPVISEWRSELVDSLLGRASHELEDTPVVRFLAKTRTVLVQPDVRVAEPRPHAEVIEAGVRAQILVPVCVADSMVGIVSVHSIIPRQWSEIDVGAAQDSGRRVAEFLAC